MATKSPVTTFVFFFLSFLLLLSFSIQGVRAKAPIPDHLGDSGLASRISGMPFETQKYSRRSMIGSTAPTCTFNECRGCRFRCRAEQVPVDANDPINSAYHYRCVCHRW